MSKLMNPLKQLFRLVLAATLLAGPPMISSARAQAPEGLPKPPEGKVTVKFWAIATMPWKEPLAEFAKVYPNIDIKWTKYSVDEIKQALRVAAASGKMPDMWTTGEAAWPRPILREDTRWKLLQKSLPNTASTKTSAQ
jgi:raffinose/stachyose/melibiose transport system substrate-binding protein